MTTLYPGQSFTIYTDFPETLDAPPHFALRRESDNALVQEGVAEQNAQNTNRWSSQITLPEAATQGLYALTWTGQIGTNTATNVERLTVGEEKSEYLELDRLVMANQTFEDVLLLDDESLISNVTVSVLSPKGTLVATATPTPISDATTPAYRAVFSDGLPVSNSAFDVYIIEWTYNADSRPITEYHFVYVSNYQVLVYVNTLRKMIDKAQLQHKNPALMYNDVDLVAFLNLGLQTINASPPTQTAYTLSSIPDSIMMYVLNAAAVQALSARYLAEAEAAFSFNGGANISLEVDRTGMIDSARTYYQSQLEDLKAVKKNIVMTTGSASGSRPTVGNSIGVLVFPRSPNLDVSGLNRTSYSLRPGDRAIFYDQLLANL